VGQNVDMPLLADMAHYHGHRIDWGNVPAWAGAILTSGTLFVGFTVLRRDKRTAERVQADKIICWHELEHPHVKVTVLNASDQLIFRVRVSILASPRKPFVRGGRLHIFEEVQLDPIEPELDSDQRLVRVGKVPEDMSFYDAKVIFREIRGWKWRRDVRRETLSRELS
jgi:hypothetical protein